MLSSSEIDKIRLYFSTKPINKAFLFGSVARDEEMPDSDIDLLVEIDKNVKLGLVKFFSMQIDLEEMLHKKVDLLAEGGVSKYILPHINQDKVLVYEKRPG